MHGLTRLQQSGQSIWLDTITRELLTSGRLARYIEDLCVTGLTSNPTIFEKAIAGSSDYDASIKTRLGRGLTTEQLFFEVAIEDIRIAADRFHPVHEAAGGRDGFVSLEVSPTLAHDVTGTVEQARRLHREAGLDNLLIKVPGTAEGVSAVEELIFAGVPVNVTLLFSTAHYEAAAEAYLRGLERRLAAGLSVDVASVASLFVSRWDRAVGERAPAEHRNRCGIAVAQRAYRAYRERYAGGRWGRLAAAGARPQRLLWASTGTKDPALPDTYYITALAAPDTVNTMPEHTLLAFQDHGEVGAPIDPASRDADRTLAALRDAGVDLEALADQLQRDGRDAFASDFDKLLRGIETKIAALG